MFSENVTIFVMEI